MIELGGNIKLDGFGNIDPAALIVVKKLVGNYAKKIKQVAGDYKELVLHLQQDGEKVFALHAQVIGAQEWNADASGSNLFFTIDTALAKVMAEVKE